MFEFSNIIYEFNVVVNLYFIAWAGPGPQPTNNNIIYNNSTIIINNKY